MIFDPPEDSLPGSEERRRHWDAAYGRRGPRGVSWYQPVPAVSLELIDALGPGPEAALIDVGGGASTLADELLAAGLSDLTVLDVSAEALALARERRGAGSPVRLVQADLLTWRPGRRYDLWHDRAVLHFLTRPAQRARYLETLAEALAPGGGVVLGAFAPDGPERCSGLPVARYAPDELAALLEGALGAVEVVATRREEHVTPGGVLQPFAWLAARRPAREPLARSAGTATRSRG